MFVRTLQPLGGKIEECKAEHFYEYKRRRKLDVTTYLLYDTRVKIKHEIENSYLSLFKYRILGRASIVYNHPEKIEMLLTKDGLICKYLLDNHKSIFGFECENMNCNMMGASLIVNGQTRNFIPIMPPKNRPQTSTLDLCDSMDT